MNQGTVQMDQKIVADQIDMLRFIEEDIIVLLDDIQYYRVRLTKLVHQDCL